MKITLKQLKQLIKEAIQSTENWRDFHAPDGKDGVVGAMDTADYYGAMDNDDNVLNFLDKLSIRYVDKDNREMARRVTKAGDAIEQGNLELADKLLVSIFEEGGEERAVYHAIAYVRTQMGDA